MARRDDNAQLSLFDPPEETGPDEPLGPHGDGALADPSPGEVRGPGGPFSQLGQEAAERYLAVRDSLLEGLSPNDGTMDWPEFQARVAQADQTARELVETELIYLPPT
jgi:hypothetical protein